MDGRGSGGKRKGVRVGAIVLTLLALLPMAFLLVHFILSRRLENRLDAIREAGYPVTLAELDAWYRFPDGPNAATVYLNAFAHMVDPPGIDLRLLPVVGEAAQHPSRSQRPGSRETSPS